MNKNETNKNCWAVFPQKGAKTPPTVAIYDIQSKQQ